MTKLGDRVLRLERQLEDNDKIERMRERIQKLEEKVAVLAKYLRLSFKEGLSVESTRDDG